MTKKRIVTLKFEGADNGDGELDIIDAKTGEPIETAHLLGEYDKETEEPMTKRKKHTTPLDDALKRTLKTAFAGLDDVERQEVEDLLEITFAEILAQPQREGAGSRWIPQDVSDIEHPIDKSVKHLQTPRLGRKAMLKMVSSLRAAGLSDNEVVGIVKRFLAAPVQKSADGEADPFTYPVPEESGVLASLVKRLVENPKGPSQVIKVSGEDLRVPKSEGDKRVEAAQAEDLIPIHKED